GGAGVDHPAGGQRRRARTHDPLRRDRTGETRPAVPWHAAVFGRHGFLGAQDLRPGGLAAVAGHLPRDFLVLDLRRLPGPPAAWVSRRARPTTWRSGCRRRTPTARFPRARTAATSRPAGCWRAGATRTPASPSSCTRSMARASRWGAP